MLLVMTATANEMKGAFPSAPAVAQGGVAEYAAGGRKLLLAVSGVGLVNTALCAGRLLARPEVEGVVNLGIAGAYDLDATPMGAPCCATEEIWPEYGLIGEDGLADPKGIGFPLGRAGGELVWNRIALTPDRDAAAMGLRLPGDWKRVPSVSVSGVAGTPQRAALLKAACGGNGTENMEGFALAYAAAGAGLPFLEVRTVSNLAGSREPGDWDLKGALRALETAAAALFPA
ncbi:futalosine hydrolase [Pseudodesulfovibrio indicus]|uniref:Futalosine hydrolase n=1 Tax=Pseudodesulfovibrio indicus TaxID=1716143 RepID=A0A126QKS7_9BACT|nr:futalosine hydrolase [Pseudodesulfovibrio indicus]AMK10554.1 futalosine hydrolase [Pseudodesulfovibrio indicus]TDT89040.1 futalosine hydrolase [Pseudodesulfovibrio indicus]